MNLLRNQTIYKDRDIKRTRHCELVNKGLFPPPIPIHGSRAKGTPEYELDIVLQARVAGRSDNEIKQLVSNLVAARQYIVGKSDEELKTMATKIYSDLFHSDHRED